VAASAREAIATSDAPAQGTARDQGDRPGCQSATSPAKHPPITYDEYAIWFATRNYEHQNHAAAPEMIDASPSRGTS